jgi:hypothetical protein
MAQAKQKPATYLASNETKLTEPEVRICQWLAKQRHSSNRSGGVADGKIGPQSCEETDLEGICGEFAFCKALNLYPDMSISPRKGSHDVFAFGKTIDVKTTKYKTGKLLARHSKNETPSELYVLVVGQCPSYKIAGWCSGSDLIKDSNLLDLGYGKTYGLEQSALKPVEKIKECF